MTFAEKILAQHVTTHHDLLLVRKFSFQTSDVSLSWQGHLAVPPPSPHAPNLSGSGRGPFSVHTIYLRGSPAGEEAPSLG